MPKQMKPPASIGVEPAAEDWNQSTDIIPDPGRCANCGKRIRLIDEPANCVTCNAWRRWHSAFRLAVETLRRASR